MFNKEPSKKNLFITLILLLITWGVTIWLFHYLTDPQKRSETFHFTLVFICFLELLFFGFFAGLFIPLFKKGMVWALYPSIGAVVGWYIIFSLGIVICYNLISFWITFPKIYFTVLTIESLIFLLILGSIIILNIYKKSEDTEIEKERSELRNISSKVQEIHQNFLNCKDFFPVEDFREVEKDIRILKERFQFCTPFGRAISGVGEIEEKILSQIASLGNLILSIHSSKEEEIKNILENIKLQTASIIQAMERREKLLIK